MKIRLYVDEDAMDDNLMSALSRQGIDALSVRDASRQGYSDKEQLQYATEQDRVLYSFNVKDYCVLHARFIESEKSHAGIIVATKGRFDIGEQMRLLSLVAGAMTAEEMKDQLLFLNDFD